MDSDLMSTVPHVRLIDVPHDVARVTARCLWQLPTRVEWEDNSSHLTVLVGQVRELSAPLRITAPLLVKLLNELFVASVTSPTQPDGVDVSPVTLALAGGTDGVREAADALTTINALAVAAGSSWLVPHPQVLALMTWLADEVESQTNGHPPTAYPPQAAPPAPPCHLLHGATAETVRPLLHAYHHTGLTRSQTIRIRTSDVIAELATRPGATLDHLFHRIARARVAVLDGIGDLIEMGVIFGIGHRWYPFDIAVAALRDDVGADRGCDCP